MTQTQQLNRHKFKGLATPAEGSSGVKMGERVGGAGVRAGVLRGGPSGEALEGGPLDGERAVEFGDDNLLA
jgi:hypothetical protein